MAKVDPPHPGDAHLLVVGEESRSAAVLRRIFSVFHGDGAHAAQGQRVEGVDLGADRELELAVVLQDLGGSRGGGGGRILGGKLVKKRPMR
jgi:hypothetical protein